MSRGYPIMARGHPGMARGRSGHPGMTRGQSGHPGMSRGQSGHSGMSRGQSGHPGMSRGYPIMARGHLALARGLPGIVRGGSRMIRGSAGMISRASGIVRRPVFPGRFVMNRGLPMSRGEFGGEIGKGFVPGEGAGSSIRNVPIAAGLTDDNSSRIASKRKGDEVDVDLTIDSEVEDTKTDLTKSLPMEDVNMNNDVN